jgi:hypothetical protein
MPSLRRASFHFTLRAPSAARRAGSLTQRLVDLLYVLPASHAPSTASATVGSCICVMVSAASRLPVASSMRPTALVTFTHLLVAGFVIWPFMHPKNSSFRTSLRCESSSSPFLGLRLLESGHRAQWSPCTPQAHLPLRGGIEVDPTKNLERAGTPGRLFSHRCLSKLVGFYTSTLGGRHTGGIRRRQSGRGACRWRWRQGWRAGWRARRRPSPSPSRSAPPARCRSGCSPSSWPRAPPPGPPASACR